MAGPVCKNKTVTEVIIGEDTYTLRETIGYYEHDAIKNALIRDDTFSNVGPGDKVNPGNFDIQGSNQKKIQTWLVNWEFPGDKESGFVFTKDSISELNPYHADALLDKIKELEDSMRPFPRKPKPKRNS